MSTTDQAGRLHVLAGSPQVRWYAFVMFAVLVALTGGATRSDVVALVILRPLAFGFAAYALFARNEGTDASKLARGPLWLLALAAAAVAWQLVPLPPALWQQLPARDTLARIDALLGLADIWRPLALSPAGAWNALFSFGVPLAGLLLYANLPAAERRMLPVVWLALAFVSAVLGLLQLLGPPDSPLYLYSRSTVGMPVGLFANNNHQAVFLGASIPVAVLWANLAQRSGSVRTAVAATGSALFLLIAVLTQSRAGIAVSVAGLGVGLVMLMQRLVSTKREQAGGDKLGARRVRGKLGVQAKQYAVPLMAGLSIAAGLGAAMIVRSSTILQLDPSTELRIQALPMILQMLQHHWLTGVGGGSFDDAFRIYEPTSLLSQYYLNQAHNDWLQVPIEYGLPGLLVLALAVVLFARAGWAVLRERATALAIRLAIVAPPLAFAAASLVDYPVRGPLIQFLLICWLLMMRDHRRLFGAPEDGRRLGARSSVYQHAPIR